MSSVQVTNLSSTSSHLQSLLPSFTIFSPKRSTPLFPFSFPHRPTPLRLVAPARAKPNTPSGEQKWTHEGSVTESLPNGMFRVLLDNKDLIIGYISGKIRKNFVRILPGDRVKVEVSRYDTSRGRIVYRHRTGARDLNTD